MGLHQLFPHRTPYFLRGCKEPQYIKQTKALPPWWSQDTPPKPIPILLCPHFLVTLGSACALWPQFPSPSMRNSTRSPNLSWPLKSPRPWQQSSEKSRQGPLPRGEKRVPRVAHPRAWHGLQRRAGGEPPSRPPESCMTGEQTARTKHPHNCGAVIGATRPFGKQCPRSGPPSEAELWPPGRCPALGPGSAWGALRASSGLSHPTVNAFPLD